MKIKKVAHRRGVRSGASTDAQTGTGELHCKADGRQVSRFGHISEQDSRKNPNERGNAHGKLDLPPAFPSFTTAQRGGFARRIGQRDRTHDLRRASPVRTGSPQPTRTPCRLYKTRVAPEAYLASKADLRQTPMQNQCGMQRRTTRPMVSPPPRKQSAKRGRGLSITPMNRSPPACRRHPPPAPPPACGCLSSRSRAVAG